MNYILDNLFFIYQTKSIHNSKNTFRRNETVRVSVPVVQPSHDRTQRQAIMTPGRRQGL